jgi:hypothetical protein
VEDGTGSVAEGDWKARIGTCTAAVIAADGDGQTALRLLDQLEQSTRVDYWDLQNRLAALARFEPESRIWGKVPMLPDSVSAALPSGRRAARAHDVVTRLAEEMRTKIGTALPQQDAPATILVRTSDLS